MFNIRTIASPGLSNSALDVVLFCPCGEIGIDLQPFQGPRRAAAMPDGQQPACLSPQLGMGDCTQKRLEKFLE